MLVGLCPNPVCSASCRCKLRVCFKRFYNKTKRQTRVRLKGGALVCLRLSGLCFQRYSFWLRRPTTLLDRGSSYFSIKSRKAKKRNREQSGFLQCRHYIEHQTFYSAYYKSISYWGARISTVMQNRSPPTAVKNQRLDSCERICLLMLISSSSRARKSSRSATWT